MLFTAGFKTILGVSVDPLGQIVIMVVIIVIYTLAAWMGLGKRSQFIGDATVWICFIWFGCILLADPRTSLLKGMVETWGAYFQNLSQMATFMDSTDQANGWSQN